MFSVKEKQHIAKEIERILLELKHPEMPNGKPKFNLHVEGKEPWSFADIDPNWTYENKEYGVNPWNENARKIMNDDKTKQTSFGIKNKTEEKDG